MKGTSHTGTARLRQYTMVVVDASNDEHTTFCGYVEEGVSEELIRKCFEKRFGAEDGWTDDGAEMHYYFDWCTQWEDGDLCASVDFKS